MLSIDFPANDIALLLLDGEINIKDEPDANVICLPQQETGSNKYDKTSCTVSGWGMTGIFYELHTSGTSY